MRLPLIGIALIVGGQVAAAEPEAFVVIQAGALPIILTAPHGGADMAGLPNRNSGTTTTDTRTLELTLNLAHALTARLGAAPYVVAAKFSRKAIDANRAPAEAFEFGAARPIYEAYHGAIRRFVDEARQRFPSGVILLDIHGQGSDASAIFRGTQNGATVKRLVARHGVAAVTGPDSILGALQAKGVPIIPPNTPFGAPREDPRYDGGFTVTTYSRAAAWGVDALQLELGMALRSRPEFADVLADAITVFYRAYLLP